MAWHPVVPLTPNHDYRIEARLVDPSDGTSSGAAAVVSNFSTSDALLEPIVLKGPLGWSLRGGQQDVFGCGPCGSGCKVTGQRRALFADVHVPAPSGGQGIYRGVLHFSDDEPAQVNPGDPSSTTGAPRTIQVPQFVKVEAGEELT